MKLAVIVCNNGLGHIKRVLNVLADLPAGPESEIHVELFVDSAKLRYFSGLLDSLKNKGHAVTYFDIDSDNSHYEKEFLRKYATHLKQANFIWSDNLLFPFKHHENVFLTGSFLWEVAGQDAQELIELKNPVMIGSRYFATKEVREVTQFVPVDLYEYYSPSFKAGEGKSILIGCGKSQAGRAVFHRQLEAVHKVLLKTRKDITVYIEPDYFREFSDLKNVLKADFSPGMFGEIQAAVIRPGMGTVHDVLCFGSRIFSFHEKNNRELSRNAAVLAKLNIGKSCEDIASALQEAEIFLSDDRLRSEHRFSWNQLRFGGIRQTAEKINQIVKDGLLCQNR